jgi:hypothetical protein
MANLVPPAVIDTHAAPVHLDDREGSGYISLRPAEPASESGARFRIVEAKLAVYYNPDGMITSIGMFWQPGQLNRPVT